MTYSAKKAAAARDGACQGRAGVTVMKGKYKDK